MYQQMDARQSTALFAIESGCSRGYTLGLIFLRAYYKSVLEK